MISQCTCKSEYQDSKYGKGNRIYNPIKKGGRCTICLKETMINTSNIEIKVEKK